MIAAYPDINGCVGEAPRLSDYAEACIASARTVHDAMPDLLRQCEDIQDAAWSCADRYDREPAGCDVSSAYRWSQIEDHLIAAQQAVAALAALMGRTP